MLAQSYNQNWYGVSGEGAVGGLVGYAKSHRTTKGELTAEVPYLAFMNCLAAVPVRGNMRGAYDTTFYYISGAARAGQPGQ